MRKGETTINYFFEVGFCQMLLRKARQSPRLISIQRNDENCEEKGQNESAHRAILAAFSPAISPCDASPNPPEDEGQEGQVADEQPPKSDGLLLYRGDNSLGLALQQFR